MTTQTEALKLALDALERGETELRWKAITAIKEALQEHALQALHDENERLGLYKGIYEEDQQHPVHIGVDVTKEGTAVTAFYRKPDSVMEMFYSQFHPLAQPEQDKERCVGCEACIDTACGRDECPKGWPKAPQRTWVGLEAEDRLTAKYMQDAPEGIHAVIEYVENRLKDKNT